MSSKKRLREHWDENPERVILGVFVAIGLYFLAGYMLMLSIGWLHYLDHRIPNLGYVTSVWAVVAWRAVVWTFPGRRS